MAQRIEQKLISSFFGQPKKKLRPNEELPSSLATTEGDPKPPTSTFYSGANEHSGTKTAASTSTLPAPAPSPCASGVPSRDIGHYIGQDISDHTKSTLLENPWTPPDNYDFPFSTRTVSGITKKNFVRQSHLKSYGDWLVFSPSKKGLFCKYCPWFTPRNEGGFGKNVPLKALVTEPLVNFKKLLGSDGLLEKHKNFLYHKNSVLAGKDFLKTFHSPVKDVCNLINEKRFNLSQENRERLLPIVKTIIMLGRQNIPLRGHRDDGQIQIHSKKHPLRNVANEGNFRAMLRFRVDAGDKVLEKHLQNASSRATYISKTSQNYLIECCRLEITEAILSRISGSRWYSVIFDETPDISTKEQVTLVLRYVHFGERAEIREDFVSFIDAFDSMKSARSSQEDSGDSDDSVDSSVDITIPTSSTSKITMENQDLEMSLTGKNLGQIVLRELESLQLPLDDCVGIGTDGCSVMLSDKVGAVKEIQKSAKNATMTPCYNHKLNLSISQSTQVPVINKATCLIKEVSSFFSFPKRTAVLSAHMGKKLKRHCETRWVGRHDGVLQFTSSLPQIIDALEDIKDWKDKKTAGNASLLAGALCDSEFIIGLFCLSDILSRTHALSALLQKESTDLARAGQVVRDLILDLEQRRTEAETHFKSIFSQVNKLAELLNIEIKNPRTCKRQTKRPNYEALEPESYFRISCYIPLLDSVWADLKTRFSKDVLDSLKLSLLLPESIVHMDIKKVNEICECLCSRFLTLFNDDNYVLSTRLNAEMGLWQQKWKGESELRKPAIEVLNLCDKDIYPTIHTLLQILCTLPASNASAEQSFSSLRRLKSWTRATMVQKRLVGLALLHVHHDIEIDPKNVINRFAKSKDHRLCL